MKERLSKYHYIFFSLWAAVQLYLVTLSKLDALTKTAVFGLFLLIGIFSTAKAKLAVKAVLIALSVCAVGYFIYFFPTVVTKGGYLSQTDLFVAGAIVVLFAIAGWLKTRSIAIMALIFFVYPFVGIYLTEPFACGSFTLRRVLSHMVWGSQGLFGLGMNVGASYIFPFIIFGAVLKAAGFSDFINDLSSVLVGKSKGGPAKVSVLASAIMGMMNGSAVANVATTGSITIPIMKSLGYRPEFAGAVEAAASTGGQFLPPVMGAVGFVMAEYMGVSYSKVILAASVPAFLYYLSLMISVHLEASKNNLKAVDIEDKESVVSVLKSRGYLLIPLFTLIGLLFIGYTPIYSAVISMAVTVAVSFLGKKTRMSVHSVVEALVEGATGSLAVGASCTLIGVIIGSVSLTSLGLSFGAFVLKMSAGSSIYVTAFFVMVMSVILGMGVPGVAAYVIVASVAVPVLIKSGASDMSAHLFCLIYACLSNITPPVAISAYIASSIAGANQFKTGIEAVKLGVVGFIVPFFFIGSNALLIGQAASAFATVGAIISSICGVCALSVSCAGYLRRRLATFERALFFAAGILLIHSDWHTDLIGVVIITALSSIIWRGYHEKA